MSLKKCVIFGNCQHSQLEKYLEKTNFIKYYNILQTYDCYCKNIQNLDKKTLSSLDIFIYQHVSEDFDTYFSSNNILKMLPEYCVKICIPNFYFSGYFPQNSKSLFERKNKSYSISPTGLMVYGDKNIDSLLSNNNDYDTIYSKISNITYYDKQIITDNLSSSIKELRKREKNYNVIFSAADWIENNYKKFKICSSVNHPNNEYYLWLVKSILQYLKISDSNVDSINLAPHFNFLEQPIYPSVKYLLELTFNNEKTRFYNEDIYFQEYVKYYINYATGNKVNNKCENVINSQEIDSCKLIPCIETVKNINKIGTKEKLLKEINITRNNYIVYKNKIFTTDNSVKNSIIKGLNIIFKGSNNIINIGDNCKFSNCQIIVNNNTTISIGKNCTFGNLKIMNCNHNFGEVEINSNVIAGDSLSIDILGNNKITIEDNCIFDRNVHIMASDGHSIIDNNNIVINPNQDVYISKHCWIGTEALLLKGTFLNINTIVNPRSVVSKKYKESNIQISGTPAHIVNVNVNWDMKNPQYMSK